MAMNKWLWMNLDQARETYTNEVIVDQMKLGLGAHTMNFRHNWIYGAVTK